MAGKDTVDISAALSANGTTTGFVTVADATGFYVKALVYLNNGTISGEYRITSIVGGVIGLAKTQVRGNHGLNAGTDVPALNPPNYGQSDVSAYTTVSGSKIYQPAQFIYGAT